MEKSLQGIAEWFVSVRSVAVKTTGSYLVLDADLLERVLLKEPLFACCMRCFM